MNDDNQSHEEWMAWQDVCAEFRTTIGNVNDKKYNRLIKLIELWGNKLALLRMSQPKQFTFDELEYLKERIEVV